VRTVVLGGTRFVGRAVVDELVEAGHEVLVVHRGEHEPDGLPDVEHLHADRSELHAHAPRLRACDALIDTCCMTGADATNVPQLDLASVVLSSIEVYRAYDSVLARTVTDEVPLTEESPLGGAVKVAVEAAYAERGGTVCRLPLVYGPHDYKRREGFVLDRLREGRIPVGPGTWRWSRGYAPELARGVRLALDHPGETFNLCERECVPIRAWMEQIAKAAGADVELVRVPDGELPEDLEITGDIPQDWMAGAEKAERVLGWTHAGAEACVSASVAWHLAHPPVSPRAGCGGSP
jgi:nucleoside-diphosphate-sugar epimerase